MDSPNSTSTATDGLGNASGISDEWYRKYVAAKPANAYVPFPKPRPCPSCGHCPSCGRGGYAYPYYPGNGPTWIGYPTYTTY